MRDQEIISIFQKFLSFTTKDSLIYQDITKDIPACINLDWKTNNLYLKEKIEKVKSWS
jgi:hypothetical protein